MIVENKPSFHSLVAGLMIPKVFRNYGNLVKSNQTFRPQERKLLSKVFSILSKRLFKIEDLTLKYNAVNN